MPQQQAFIRINVNGYKQHESVKYCVLKKKKKNLKIVFSKNIFTLCEVSVSDALLLVG